MGGLVNLILVSKRKDLHQWFEKAAYQFRSFKILRPAELSELKGEEDFIAYIHYPELSPSQQKKWSEYPQYQRGYYGIINLEEQPRDPAGLMHRGYVDVISIAQLKEDSEKRLSQVLFYLNQEQGEKLVEESWDDFVEGKVYPFLFFFIELDHAQHLKNKLGIVRYQKVCDYFKRSLEDWLEHHQGLIWMWQNEGGLILFPAVKDPGPVVGAVRYFINRPINQVGWFSSSLNLTYHGVFSHSQAEYRSKGTTGGIISDHLNTFFHLTKKCSEPGRLYLKEDTLELLKESFQTYFTQVKEIEEKVYVLKKNKFD